MDDKEGYATEDRISKLYVPLKDLFTRTVFKPVIPISNNGLLKDGNG